MRHSCRRFCPFGKDGSCGNRSEVHVEKTLVKIEKEEGKYSEYHKRKTHDTGESTMLKKEVEEKQLTGNLVDIAN